MCTGTIICSCENTPSRFHRVPPSYYYSGSDWEKLLEWTSEMPPVIGAMVSDWEQRNRNCETWHCTRDGLILDGMGSVLLPHPGLDTRKCIVFRKKPLKLFEQTVSHLQTHSVTCTQQQTTVVWWEIRNLGSRIIFGHQIWFCSSQLHIWTPRSTGNFP